MKYLNTPIPKDLNDRLDQYCKDQGMLKKKVVELAIAKYLKDRKE